MLKAIHLFGSSNEIAKLVAARYPQDCIERYDRHQVVEDYRDGKGLALRWRPEAENYFVYTWGILYPKRLTDQSYTEACEGFILNFLLPAALLETANKSQYAFRYVYLSSESARKGSYDGGYAFQKAATQKFIRECRLVHPHSMAVAVAPSMISDAGMTVRRSDAENVRMSSVQHPKGRLTNSAEVASVVCWLLNEAPDYLTNSVLELNGGKFSRMVYL